VKRQASAAEDSDRWHCWLLRAYHERPGCRRATEQRDEIRGGCSFDHLVGEREQRRRHGEAKRLCGNHY
jgi:hypothetical protein